MKKGEMGVKHEMVTVDYQDAHDHRHQHNKLLPPRQLEGHGGQEVAVVHTGGRASAKSDFAFGGVQYQDD